MITKDLFPQTPFLLTNISGATPTIMRSTNLKTFEAKFKDKIGLNLHSTIPSM